MAKMGRPSIYTPELCDRICERLGNGEPLRTICKDDDMPVGATVYSWIRLYPEFLERYEKAKQESSDALVEEMLSIADDENPEDTQRARLRVDTRKWIAAKLKPKKYGEQIDLTSGGQALPQPILNFISHVPSNNGDTKDSESPKAD